MWEAPADELEGDLEAEPTDELDQVYEEPRSVDVATWVARGIVVLTIGLLAVLGGLFLGMSVTDTSPTATPTPAPPATSSTMGEQESGEAVVGTESQAPALRISPAVPGAAAATNSAATSTASVATRAPATAEPSPTASATPRGKGTNSGKPRPTKTR
jgi:hypothetical protein